VPQLPEGSASRSRAPRLTAPCCLVRCVRSTSTLRVGTHARLSELRQAALEGGRVPHGPRCSRRHVSGNQVWFARAPPVVFLHGRSLLPTSPRDLLGSSCTDEWASSGRAWDRVPRGTRRTYGAAPTGATSRTRASLLAVARSLVRALRITAVVRVGTPAWLEGRHPPVWMTVLRAESRTWAAAHRTAGPRVAVLHRRRLDAAPRSLGNACSDCRVHAAVGNSRIPRGTRRP
jgi:hypothetical protein